MELLLLFAILTILNTVIQTIKSIATIKCGKTAASLVNAVAYGLYTYVVFFTASDGIDLHAKAAITAVANLIGVYIVKLLEEKARKDKLWQVQATVLRGHTERLHSTLDRLDIPHNYLENVGKYTLFNIYCETQRESALAKEVLEKHDAKYFVSESKTL